MRVHRNGHQRHAEDQEQARQKLRQHRTAPCQKHAEPVQMGADNYGEGEAGAGVAAIIAEYPGRLTPVWAALTPSATRRLGARRNAQRRAPASRRIHFRQAGTCPAAAAGILWIDSFQISTGPDFKNPTHSTNETQIGAKRTHSLYADLCGTPFPDSARSSLQKISWSRYRRPWSSRRRPSTTPWWCCRWLHTRGYAQRCQPASW